MYVLSAHEKSGLLRGFTSFYLKGKGMIRPEYEKKIQHWRIRENQTDLPWEHFGETKQLKPHRGS